MQFRPHLLPGNRLDLTGFDLTNAALDLFCPRGFHTGVRFRFKGLEKEAGEFCAISLRELNGLQVQFLKSSTHD